MTQVGCEDEIVGMIRERQAAGLRKYGVTVERKDLSAAQWIRHAQEEALDLAIYLERLKRELNERMEAQ